MKTQPSFEVGQDWRWTPKNRPVSKALTLTVLRVKADGRATFKVWGGGVVGSAGMEIRPDEWSLLATPESENTDG